MNLPNKITLSRFILTIIFVFLVCFDFRGSYILATLVYVLAAISDFFDGYYARKYNVVTNFGKLMDPLADKVLVSACFIFLSHAGVFPFWGVIVIVAREFFVTGLRSIASGAGVTIGADSFGKWKTTFQLICSISLLDYLCIKDGFSLHDFVLEFFAFDFYRFIDVPIFSSLAILLTALSGINYAIRYRHLFKS